jgi:hypothetical protein
MTVVPGPHRTAVSLGPTDGDEAVGWHGARRGVGR